MKKELWACYYDNGDGHDYDLPDFIGSYEECEQWAEENRGINGDDGWFDIMSNEEVHHWSGHDIQ